DGIRNRNVTGVQTCALPILTIFSIAIILVGSGVLWTFLKYGKYEIASDQDHIYIHMGILSERSLMIRKDNVQAIQIIQTPIKKRSEERRVGKECRTQG